MDICTCVILPLLNTLQALTTSEVFCFPPHEREIFGDILIVIQIALQRYSSYVDREEKSKYISILCNARVSHLFERFRTSYN